MKKRLKYFFILNFFIFIFILIYNYNFSIYLFDYLNDILLYKYAGTIFNIQAGETFVAILHLTLYLTLLMLLPLFMVYFYKYFYKGMEDKEKRFLSLLVFSYFVGLLGVIFSVYISFNIFLPYFFNYNNLIGIGNYLSVNALLIFAIQNAILFFIIFQIPFVIKSLINNNLVPKETFKKHRKHSFFVILLFSSIMSPPDLMTTGLFSGIIFLLYNVSII